MGKTQGAVIKMLQKLPPDEDIFLPCNGEIEAATKAFVKNYRNSYIFEKGIEAALRAAWEVRNKKNGKEL